jgi:acetyl esterase/lipase
MRDGLNWHLAYDSQAVVVAVEYRLAPETPFPGPLNDCYCGLVWVFANAAPLNVDSKRIAVMGESGGGGLAAAVALKARDRAEVRLAGQMLIYPMLDYRTGSPREDQPNPTTGHFGWTRNNNQFGWRCFRGDLDLSSEQIGYFSPALAAQIASLPPTFIAVGSLDLFMDEDLAYASRLSRAGVAVEFHLYPGAIHGFDLMRDTALGRQFRFDQLEALRRWFNRPQDTV